MPRVVDEFWKSGEGWLHLRIHGEAGAPAVLVWPGAVGTAWDHEALCQVLARDRYVYAVSPPGCGPSDWLSTARDYGFEGLVATALGVVAKIGGGPIDWIGTSRGGALGLALTESGVCIRRLVLNDIGAVAPLAYLHRVGTILGQRTRLHTLPQAAAETERRFGTQCFVSASAAHWRALALAHWRRTDDGGFTEHYDPALPEHLVQMGRWADQTSAFLNAPCDILVLRGSLSPAVSAAHLKQLASQRPSLKAITLQGFGHAAFLDAPAHQRLILDFLKERQ